jgi:hypothetical protein
MSFNFFILIFKLYKRPIPIIISAPIPSDYLLPYFSSNVLSLLSFNCEKLSTSFNGFSKSYWYSSYFPIASFSYLFIQLIKLKNDTPSNMFLNISFILVHFLLSCTYRFANRAVVTYENSFLHLAEMKITKYKLLIAKTQQWW